MDESNRTDHSASATDEPGAGQTEPSPDADALFDALADERRRYLLYSLFDEEERSLERLAATLAAWEADAPESDVPPEEVERVYASLHHAHVPKLADLDIVAFDPAERTVARGQAATPALDVLDRIAGSSAGELERHAREMDPE